MSDEFRTGWLGDTTPVPLTDERYAYHESGHAMAHFHEGLCFKMVTLREVQGTQLVNTNEEITSKIIAYCAGAGSEKKKFLKPHPDGSIQDYDCALDLARKLTHDEQEAVALVEEAKLRAEKIVLEHWPGVVSLAEELLLKKSLTYDEAHIHFEPK